MVTETHTLYRHAIKRGEVIHESRPAPWRGSTLRVVTSVGSYSYSSRPLRWYERVCYAIFGKVL